MLNASASVQYLQVLFVRKENDSSAGVNQYNRGPAQCIYVLKCVLLDRFKQV